MTKPSIDHKAFLRHQLKTMEPQEWLAIVRWTVFRLVEEPELLVQIMTDEANRRRIRHADAHPELHELAMSDAFFGVLKDLNLYIGQTRQ